MRVVTVIGVLLVGGAASVSAQHAHQLEFGGFGTYTRYDPVFGLKRQAGGGGRLGFFLSDVFSLEVDASLTHPAPTAGGPTTQVRFGSASIVINSETLYLLGGYSRLDMGVNPPYNFALNAVHAGLGDRISFGNRVALRLEARAYYAPTSCCTGGKKPLNATASAGVSVFLLGGKGLRAPAPPPVPPAVRESILAAGGKVPEAERPPAPVYQAPTEHAHQVELGGFASYTRYDRAFQLANQLGVGGRLGYFFNDYIGLEVDANLARPLPKSGSGILVGGQPGLRTQMRFGSVSLVINGGTGKSILYVLGGYSRLDMGVNPPYNFAVHAAHGALGDRIFLTNRLALRLEARAYYAPKNCCLTQQWVGHVLGSAGLSYFFGGRREEVVPEIPKAKRDSILAAGGRLPEERPRGGGPSYEQRAGDWQHKWYWGGQGGLFIFKTNFNSYSFEPMFGGHWLITGRRTALYTAYEESFFISPRHTTFVEPNGTVEPGNISFNNLRRLMVGVLAFPAQTRVEPFGGGGFALMEALNVQASCTNCTPSDLALLQQEADAAATKAFVWLMGGIDIKQGRLALYGHYVLTSSSASFLIQGSTHTFQGGIRYSLGSAKEQVTDRQ